jgi:hypothetical protein
MKRPSDMSSTQLLSACAPGGGKRACPALLLLQCAEQGALGSAAQPQRRTVFAKIRNPDPATASKHGHVFMQIVELGDDCSFEERTRCATDVMVWSMRAVWKRLFCASVRGVQLNVLQFLLDTEDKGVGMPKPDPRGFASHLAQPGALQPPNHAKRRVDQRSKRSAKSVAHWETPEPMVQRIQWPAGF